MNYRCDNVIVVNITGGVKKILRFGKKEPSTSIIFFCNLFVDLFLRIAFLLFIFYDSVTLYNFLEVYHTNTLKICALC